MGNPNGSLWSIGIQEAIPCLKFEIYKYRISNIVQFEKIVLHLSPRKKGPAILVADKIPADVALAAKDFAVRSSPTL